MLDVRVLGPLEVRGPNGDIAVGGRKQRIVLALLLLHAGHFVSRSDLVDALWPEDPPASAVQTIESYVSRLRSVLRKAGADGDLIVWGPAGYRISLNGSQLDSEEFGRRALAAREAFERGNAAEALALASSALSLWRGPALAGLDDPFRTDVGALEERRLAVLDTLAEAGLARGEPQEVFKWLRPELARHPAREHLRALAMTALYRLGRQADALEMYRDARRYLVEELGLEPGTELRELHQRILQRDPSLAPRLSGDRAPPPVRDVPPPRDVPLPRDERRERTRRRRRRRLRIGVVSLAGFALISAIAWSVAGTGGGTGTRLSRTLGVPAVRLIDGDTGHSRAASALSGVPTGLAASADAVWASSFDNGTLLRLDGHDLAVSQTIRVGDGPTGLALAAGDVWVALSQEGALARVDGATNGVVQRVRVGTDPTAVAAGAHAVWVANTGDGTVSRVDPYTGSVLGTTVVGAKPRGIAVGAGGVWVTVSGADVVARLDPRSGRVVDRIHTGDGPTVVAPGPDGIWIANALDSTVSLIDPTTDTVTLTVGVPGTPVALAVSRGGVWVAAFDRPILTHVEVSGRIERTRLPAAANVLAPAPRGIVVGVLGAKVSHRGGTVVMKTSFPIGQINPDQCCDVPPNVRALSYDSLLSFSKLPGSAGTLVPDLALEVPRTQAGGRLYTFRLRPGLRYWNGQPVRASDFVRGLERAAAASDVWAAYLAALPGALACPHDPRSCDLRNAVIPDDRAGTITFKLSHTDPELLSALALPGFAPAPSGDGITPGTGPYRITRYVPDRLIVEERNRYFREWAPAAQPAGYPDRIVVDSGQSATSDIEAVLTGRADYTFDSPGSQQLAQIELREPGQLHVSPMPNVDYLFLDTRAAPFDDVRVRRAINYATDRAAIAQLFGGSAAAQPDCQVIPATVPGHQPDCPYTHGPSRSGRWTGPDRVKARSLIAASGARGTRVSVLTEPGLSSDEATGRYFVDLLRQLGFRAHLRLLPSAQRDAAIIDYRHPALAGTISWTADFPSPSQWITQQLSCTAWTPPTQLNNHAEFCDRAVDALARRAAARESVDPTAANRLWERADRAITDLAPWVPTVSENEIDLLSRRAGNYQYVPTIGVLIDQLWVR